MANPEADNALIPPSISASKQGFQVTPGNRNHTKGCHALTDCANPNPCFYYCLLLCLGKTVCSTALSSAYEEAFYCWWQGHSQPIDLY